jgi:hypothetical protein
MNRDAYGHAIQPHDRCDSRYTTALTMRQQADGALMRISLSDVHSRFFAFPCAFLCEFNGQL